MVGVEMCEPECVDESHIFPDKLKAQLRGYVHQKEFLLQPEERAVPGSAVPWVIGGAGGAPASDDGNPEGSSGPEEGELHA